MSRPIALIKADIRRWQDARQRAADLLLGLEGELKRAQEDVVRDKTFSRDVVFKLAKELVTGQAQSISCCDCFDGSEKISYRGSDYEAVLYVRKRGGK